MSLPKLHHTKLEKRGKGLALVCDCCSYAFAYIPHDRLVVSSRHGKEQHANCLTSDDLRKIADLLDSISGTLKVEKAA